MRIQSTFIAAALLAGLATTALAQGNAEFLGRPAAAPAPAFNRSSPRSPCSLPTLP